MIKVCGLVVSLLAMTACAPDEQASKAGAGDKPGELSMKVISAQQAEKSEEAWGQFAQYFDGETAGVSDLLSGTATIKPGMEIHPPHRHAEEEFLMVIEGRGTWTVGDQSFEAGEGDMLYAAAWDLHGIKNTGEVPLTFVFWKWNSKGLPVPVDPEL